MPSAEKVLGKEVLRAYSEFREWHFDLKNTLDKLDVNSVGQLAYLDRILPGERNHYFNEINRLGALTEGYRLEQKQYFFQFMATNGLHHILKGAPYFYHSIFKPRGYAGDAEMMALVYRNTYEGSDTFSKLLHRIGTDCDACVAIRNRKNLLADSFLEFQSGKVLSLAAGPAQEIYEYLDANHQDKDFLALDHDIQTLRNANGENPLLKYGIANAFHLIKGNKRYLLPRRLWLNSCDPKKDVKGFRRSFLPLKYSIGTIHNNSWDLVYSAGLFDYIKTFEDPAKGTVALTRALFDAVKPGGRLLIGNISPKLSIGVKWAMECLCDWYLIHRIETEMLDFARSIPSREIASINVIAEETGVNWFLDIRKR